MKTKHERVIKRIMAYVIMLAILLGICPQVDKREARAATAYSVSLKQLGKLGAFTAGKKSKSSGDNWWQMTVNGQKSFCLSMGLTCHSGDSYEEKSSGVYKSHGTATTYGPLYACIGYWYDEVHNRSNKAYAMAQALCWTIEEGGESKSALTSAIRTVKNNTGWFSSKSAEELYQTIFQYLDSDKAEVQASYTRYEYTGKQSGKRQVLMNLRGNKIPPLPEWETYSTSKRYRQRITLYKVDEDGNPVQNVEFALTVNNVDECYYILCNGNGEATEDTDFGSANTDFFNITGTTDANGRLYYIFAFRLQTKEYGYVKSDLLNKLDADAKKKVKAQMDDEDVGYGSGLTKSEAESLAAADLQKQFDQISNTFVIQETNTNNGNLIVDDGYSAGKTITIDAAHSWFRDDAGGYWEDKHWQDEGKGAACDYPKNVIETVKNEYKRISYKIQKDDSYATDGKAHGDATLKGAKYRLFTDQSCTVPATVYTDENGAYSAECPVMETDKNGEFTTSFLRGGVTYWLKEIEASEGYLINDTPVAITADGTADTRKVQPDKDTIHTKESPVLGKIRIHKIMDNAPESGSHMVEPEVGAQFSIYLQSKGSYENCDDYERDIITTSEDGIAMSKDLYYGTYIVEQISTGGKDTEMMAPFKVVIDKSEVVLDYTISDPLFKAFLRVVKVDNKTEQTVLKEGTSYQIYEVTDSGDEILVKQSRSNGNKMETRDTWTTDGTGEVMTFSALTSGTYRLYETDAASGFHVTTKFIEVVINSKADNYESYLDENGYSHAIVTVTYKNEETYGKMKVYKSGEMLTGFQDGKFVYENRFLKGAVFEVTAAEDIVTQDNQGTHWYDKGDLVTTITTGEGAEFAKDCKDITGYTVDEDGIVTVSLPLGKYHVKEKKTLYGYVLPDKGWDVEFTWDNKDEEYVLNATDVTDESGVLRVENARAKAQVSLFKSDATTKQAVAGAEFGIYTKHDIFNVDGEKIVDAGTRLGTVTTGADGRAVSNLDFPLMSEEYDSGDAETPSVEIPEETENPEETEKSEETETPDADAVSGSVVTLNSGDYYLKELSVPGSYYLNETEYPVHLEYKDQETKVIAAEVEAVNTQTSTVISKTSIANSEELPGCELQITDAAGNVIVSWISGNKDSIRLKEKLEELGYCNVTVILDEKGAVQVNGLLHDTTYTLTETRPADGFATADSISFQLVQGGNGQTRVVIVNGENRTVQTDNVVHMVDDTTKVEISKTEIAGSEEIPGCELEITEKDTDTIIESWTSTKKKHIVEQKFVAGKTYVLTEKRPADGYATADSIEFTVEDTGKIQSVGMKDDTTKIRLIKLADDTGQGLPDAKFEVYDSSDKKVMSFDSNEEGYDIIGKLKAGETYTFKETEAPKGYQLAEPVQYTVKDTGEVQKVSVTDRRTPKPKVPQTGGTTPLVAAVMLMVVLGSGVIFCRKRMRAK